MKSAAVTHHAIVGGVSLKATLDTLETNSKLPTFENFYLHYFLWSKSRSICLTIIKRNDKSAITIKINTVKNCDSERLSFFLKEICVNLQNIVMNETIWRAIDKR